LAKLAWETGTEHGKFRVVSDSFPSQHGKPALTRQVLVRVGDCIMISQISNVQGELPDWVREGEKVSMRISARAIQLLPPGPKPAESIA
jgi:hypothetical protein